MTTEPYTDAAIAAHLAAIDASETTYEAELYDDDSEWDGDFQNLPTGLLELGDHALKSRAIIAALIAERDALIAHLADTHGETWGEVSS